MTNVTKTRKRGRGTGQTVADEEALAYSGNFPYLRKLQFLEDEDGRRRGVLIPMDAFRRLMLDYRSIATVLNLKEQDFLDWDEALAELRADGIVPSKS